MSHVSTALGYAIHPSKVLNTKHCIGCLPVRWQQGVENETYKSKEGSREGTHSIEKERTQREARTQERGVMGLINDDTVAQVIAGAEKLYFEPIERTPEEQDAYDEMIDNAYYIGTRYSACRQIQYKMSEWLRLERNWRRMQGKKVGSV